MSYTQRLIAKLNAGLHTFVSLVINANRDFPYSDYETATLTSKKVHYVVGNNNQLGKGTQHKLFVSKSTAIYSTVDAFVIFNGSENVPQAIIAGAPITFEHSIYCIDYYYSQEAGTIHIWCEGVNPQEVRKPE